MSNQTKAEVFGIGFDVPAGMVCAGCDHMGAIKMRRVVANEGGATEQTAVLFKCAMFNIDLFALSLKGKVRYSRYPVDCSMFEDADGQAPLKDEDFPPDMEEEVLEEEHDDG